MLYPVACKTCNKRLGGLQRRVEAWVDRGYSLGDAMTKEGIIKICCRMHAMSPAVYLEAIDPIFVRDPTDDIISSKSTREPEPNVSVPDLPSTVDSLNQRTSMTNQTPNSKKFVIPRAYFAR